MLKFELILRQLNLLKIVHRKARGLSFKPPTERNEFSVLVVRKITTMETKMIRFNVWL